MIDVCDDPGLNCYQVPKKVCINDAVNTLKAIPQTSCDQKSHEICVTPACPLVVKNEVCEDITKTFVSMVPKENCELHPREVCTDIVKQYPSLKMVSHCDILPRETCSPERVQPREVVKPVIKKVCTLKAGFEITTISPNLPTSTVRFYPL